MPPITNPMRRLALAGLALPLALAMAAAVAADDAPASADAQAKQPKRLLDLRRQQPVSGDAHAGEALAAVCAACHGSNGIGVAPNFPNLAGQSATYLYVQLKTFKDGQRRDPVMAPMVASLGDGDMRNLAAYFASLPRIDAGTSAQAQAQAESGQGASGQAGARLFDEGDPARGIPPCQGCHGPGGKGPSPEILAASRAPQPPWATIPRLQGQSGAYVAKALHDFRSDARSGTSNAAIMNGVAQTLDEADIQSLADFIPAQ